MKRIINGIRYDTEKSYLIGSYDNIGAGAQSTNDFHFWAAKLYRTPRSGKYFLAGEGHAMSQFGTGTGWGSGIIPMTEAEALEWAEQYLASSEIEAHFGHLIEDA